MMDLSDHRSASEKTTQDAEREGHLDADVRSLEATLRIDVDEECPITIIRDGESIQHIDIEEWACTVTYESGDIENLCQTVKNQRGVCSCETEITGDSATVQLRMDRMTACICSTFKKHNCTPRIESVSENVLTVSSNFINRSQFKDVISELQRLADSVHVKQLGEPSPTDQLAESVEVDIDTLSRKQREIILLAMERGYFDNPRKISQEELADELDISPSMVSRRLRAIQSKIFSQIESIMK